MAQSTMNDVVSLSDMSLPIRNSAIESYAQAASLVTELTSAAGTSPESPGGSSSYFPAEAQLGLRSAIDGSNGQSEDQLEVQMRKRLEMMREHPDYQYDFFSANTEIDTEPKKFVTGMNAQPIGKSSRNNSVIVRMTADASESAYLPQGSSAALPPVGHHLPQCCGQPNMSSKNTKKKNASKEFKAMKVLTGRMKTLLKNLDDVQVKSYETYLALFIASNRCGKVLVAEGQALVKNDPAHVNLRQSLLGLEEKYEKLFTQHASTLRDRQEEGDQEVRDLMSVIASGSRQHQLQFSEDKRKFQSLGANTGVLHCTGLSDDNNIHEDDQEDTEEHSASMQLIGNLQAVVRSASNHDEEYVLGVRQEEPEMLMPNEGLESFEDEMRWAFD